jgi:hypothetical protein
MPVWIMAAASQYPGFRCACAIDFSPDGALRERFIVVIRRPECAFPLASMLRDEVRERRLSLAKQGGITPPLPIPL